VDRPRDFGIVGLDRHSREAGVRHVGVADQLGLNRAFAVAWALAATNRTIEIGLGIAHLSAVRRAVK